jgi:hypothetical protein
MYYSFEPNERFTKEQRVFQFKIARGIFGALIAGTLILGAGSAISYYLLHVPGANLILFADVCGIISSVVTLFQWIPQIYEVYKLKVFLFNDYRF